MLNVDMCVELLCFVAVYHFDPKFRFLAEMYVVYRSNHNPGLKRRLGVEFLEGLFFPRTPVSNDPASRTAVCRDYGMWRA